jgi:CubicO group peptidase (beta-lactamase class C family)
VIDHLPWFRVADPWITRALNLRDLLSHRSGLTRDDALWYASDRSTRDVVRRLRFQGSELPFRAGWLYNNNMYLTAGEVIAARSGQTWDDFTMGRILRPLGMRTASTTIRGLERLPNVAAPHAVIGDQLVPVPYRNIDNAAPAGSINASALDMARWLTFQIDSGRIDGRRLLSRKQFEEMWAGHAIIRDPFYRQLLGGGGFLEYGLGWFLGAHEGRRLILHGGNIDGMSALVSFLPEERIGVVILTNKNQTFVHTGLTFWIYDRLLGLPPVDRSARLLALAQAASKADSVEAAKVEASRIQGTAPSLPLAAYAGPYTDSLYGSIEVRMDGGALAIEINPGFLGTLEHWHYDTFRARYRDPVAYQAPKRFVSFRLDPAGKVVGATVDGFATFGRGAAK